MSRLLRYTFFCGLKSHYLDVHALALPGPKVRSDDDKRAIVCAIPDAFVWGKAVRRQGKLDSVYWRNKKKTEDEKRCQWLEQHWCHDKEIKWMDVTDV
jgi:hypothetical protein